MSSFKRQVHELKLIFQIIDAYVPDCDSQGFYRPTQCHSKIGICWCVDKHGIEFANTRSRFRSTCRMYKMNLQLLFHI